MSEKIAVPIRVIKEDLIPEYATEYSSGCDVRAAIEEDVVIASQESKIIPTGVFFALPAGYEVQVRPRSGFAAKNQVTVLNAPGTIDSDYRGQINVILINHGKQDFIVTPKMRIAQLVVCPVIQAEFLLQESLSTTKRGAGKFGHTGTH